MIRNLAKYARATALGAISALALVAGLSAPVSAQTVNTQNYTVQTYKGLFGETQAKAVSASGIEYVVPGSSMERARSYERNGFPNPPKCADGKPAVYKYHFPGNALCDADRPQ